MGRPVHINESVVTESLKVVMMKKKRKSFVHNVDSNKKLLFLYIHTVLLHIFYGQKLDEIVTATSVQVLLWQEMWVECRHRTNVV